MAELKKIIKIGNVNMKPMVNIWNGRTGEKIDCSDP